MWKYCWRGFTSKVTQRVSPTNSKLCCVFLRLILEVKGLSSHAYSFSPVTWIPVLSHIHRWLFMACPTASWKTRAFLSQTIPSICIFTRLFVILSRNFLNELLLLYLIIFLSFINIAMSLQCTPCIVPLMQSLRCCSFPTSVLRD